MKQDAVPMIDQDLLVALAELSCEAGRKILEIYAEEAKFRVKADSSPVTEADERAEELLLARLADLMPGVPVLAEESASRGQMPTLGDTFLLVDPLDGTKEFLARNGEFTVNVALVRGGRPVAGCVHAPALGATWIGADGHGARLARGAVGTTPDIGDFADIAVRPRPAGGLVAVASRSHSDAATEAFLATLPIAERRSAGSSLKFCLLAEGAADVYPRFGPTMEWDTGAGHAVLLAAGGTVLTPEGAPFLYGKRDANYRNGPFIAWAERPAR